MRIRIAECSDIERLKKIWRLCFKDDENYISFFYKHKFKPKQTLLLLEDDIIAAMLTMLPLSISIPSSADFSITMLYAIATHPNFQGKRLASKLIDYSNALLKENKEIMSVLVPANDELFGFYYKLGYVDGFYIRQSILGSTQIDAFNTDSTNACSFTPVNAGEYNAIRNSILKNRIYIKYFDEDIAYQKKLSQAANADIYKIEFESIYGCAVIEKLPENRLFIKEILLPDEYLHNALRYVANLYSANEYIVRTPADNGVTIGGIVRPFAVCKPLDTIDFKHEKTSYLALAFD